MITDIRKQLQTSAHRFILWLIIIAIALGFIVPSILQRTTGGGSWAITVNKEEIPYQEFVREVADQRNRLASFKAEYGQIADLLLQSMGISADPKTLAFNRLIKDELLNQFAQQLGLYLHSDYIVQKMNNQQFVQQYLAHVIPPFVFDNTGTINEKVVNMYLKRQGLSNSTFERSIERALVQQFVMDLIDAVNYVPLFDIKQQYVKDSASKKFSLLFFSFADFLKKEKGKTITDETLKEFFEKQNKQFKRYWVPEKRGGIRWKFSPQSYGIVVPKEEIATYYEDNKIKKFVEEPTKVQVRQILVKDPAIVSLATIREELLKNPDEFAQKAQEISQDPTSAKNGGLLEPFARGQKEDSIERAAFLLKKDGDISKIIKTEEGEVLLQRVKKMSQTYKSLARIEDEIKATLQEQKFQKEFAQDMKRIIENQDDPEQLLKELIAKKGGKPDTINPIEKGDTKLTQALFKLKKDLVDFYIEDNTGVAVKLTTIKKEYLPTLESIKSVVMDDLYEKQATEAINRSLKKAKQEVKSKSFDEIAKEFNLDKEETGWLKPQDSAKKKSLKERGLSVATMMQLDAVGLIRDEKVGQDKYLIRLDEIEVPKTDPDEEGWEKAKESVEQRQTNLYKEAFVASLFRPATIKTNESVILGSEEYSI